MHSCLINELSLGTQHFRNIKRQFIMRLELNGESWGWQTTCKVITIENSWMSEIPSRVPKAAILWEDYFMCFYANLVGDWPLADFYNPKGLQNSRIWWSLKTDNDTILPIAKKNTSLYSSRTYNEHHDFYTL